jgi:NAD(P)-dependent dehydrogenase (short-subunit alcohol dehydrogenase family)
MYCHVFIIGRRLRELDEAIEKIGNNVIGVQGDMSDLADIDRLYYSVKKQKGQIDILFANAGISKSSPMEKISEEQFDKTFSINVKGVFFTVQKALPLF